MGAYTGEMDGILMKLRVIIKLYTTIIIIKLFELAYLNHPTANPESLTF